MKSSILLLLTFSVVFSQFVFPEDKCGPHAEYLECGNNQPTCDAPVAMRAPFCLEPGCHCVHPFVLHNAECIIPTDCPQYKKKATTPAQKKCGENELYTTCGYCEGSCSEPLGPPCDRICQRAGCYCPLPLVRHQGKCIKLEQCPAAALNIRN